MNGRPPNRQDIDPIVDLPHLAANLLIADVVPEGYRYRLAGSAVVERYKEEMTGKLAGSSRFMRRVRPQLLEHYDAVRDSRMPRLMKSGAGSEDHAAAITIMLPLVGRSGETEMILLGVFFDRRFDVIDQIDYLGFSTPQA